tara:strand:- start:553 stop:1305 length:753 start_codon:yes stop_codon:yes gene_type:complete
MFQGKKEMRNELENFFENELIKVQKESQLNLIEIFKAFPIISERQGVASFISRYELFKKIINVQGSIIICGVYTGFDLFSFYHLSSILEPVNHQRRIYGFDTFEGFKGISKNDKTADSSKHMYEGGQKAGVYNFLKKLIEVHDNNRFLKHIKKVELVKGNFLETCDPFLKNNPHLICSMLYLDFDLYKPTLHALKKFYNLMPKGGVIVFDQLNLSQWPGESMAVKEFFKNNQISIKRFSWDSVLSYTIKE